MCIPRLVLHYHRKQKKRHLFFIRKSVHRVVTVVRRRGSSGLSYFVVLVSFGADAVAYRNRASVRIGKR